MQVPGGEGIEPEEVTGEAEEPELDAGDLLVEGVLGAIRGSSEGSTETECEECDEKNWPEDHNDDQELSDSLSVSLKNFEFVEVLVSQVKNGKIRAALRIDEQESLSWNSIVSMLLLEEVRQEKGSNSFSLHICKQLKITRDPPYKLLYMWNLIVKGDDLSAAVADACRVLDMASIAPVLCVPKEAPKARIPKRKFRKHGKEVSVPHKPQPIRNTGGRQLMSYALGADHVVPEVSLHAKGPGRRKGAHYTTG
jgi:hypothetical protein